MNAAARKVEALCRLLSDRIGGQSINDVLVVGCGDGREAAFLADWFDAWTYGIDLVDRFDETAAKHLQVSLNVMDATDLDLSDNTFDLVYSFHALEHIHHPDQALAEMARVLRPGGWYCIGTPNRNRLIGYIGSPTTLANKLRWNAQDYRMRAKGQFRNECGAHAGYTQRELTAKCVAAFGQTTEITDWYYTGLYPNRAVTAVARAKAGRWVWPCVYNTGRTP